MIDCEIPAMLCQQILCVFVLGFSVSQLQDGAGRSGQGAQWGLESVSFCQLGVFRPWLNEKAGVGSGHLWGAL